MLEFRLRRRGDEKVLREILGSIHTQQEKDSYTDNRNLHRIVLKAYFSVFLSPAALVERFFLRAFPELTPACFCFKLLIFWKGLENDNCNRRGGLYRFGSNSGPE